MNVNGDQTLGAKTQVPHSGPNCLMTKKEAAARLSISTRTLDRLVARKLLSKVFVLGAVRFRERDIDRIVSEGI